MKIKLTLELDIPEEIYKDDVEDIGIPKDKLPDIYFNFVKQWVSLNIINFSIRKHMEDAAIHMEKGMTFDAKYDKLSSDIIKNAKIKIKKLK